MRNTSVLILLFCLLSDNVTSVKVKVEEGWLEGQILEASTGKGSYYSFKGIPYAKPPVGTLRFRAPETPLHWKGVRNATVHGSVCVQFKDYFKRKGIMGNEDCLFLNVYSPNLKFSPLMPVMFYIHGGFYSRGSGNDDFYGPDFLMGKGIVLVTINYRLNMFGFLSVDSEIAPGNAGLKDQIAALQWVKSNIAVFGGDPSKVTIFGDSTGGSSVSLHMLSPAAKDLFYRAIIMSAVYLKYWAFAFDPEIRALAVARKLGVKVNNTSELITFLQNTPARKLICTRPDVLLMDEPSASLLNTIYFMPVVEKKFGNGVGQYLTESPASLLSKQQLNSADLLIGHTAQEGLLNVDRVTNKILKLYPNYKELLVPHKISYYRSPKTVLKLGDRIQRFYFGNQSIGLNTIKNIVTYTSYSQYVYDVHAYIESLPKLGSRRYFYEFAIYSSRNFYSKSGAMKFGIKQATHMDDLPYLFSGSGYNDTVDVNGTVFKYVQLMTTLYTNFAKFGTPTPDNSLGLIWPEYNPYRSYVLIGETGKLSTGNVSYNTNTSIGFWHQLYLSTGINL